MLPNVNQICGLLTNIVNWYTRLALENHVLFRFFKILEFFQQMSLSTGEKVIFNSNQTFQVTKCHVFFYIDFYKEQGTSFRNQHTQKTKPDSTTVLSSSPKGIIVSSRAQCTCNETRCLWECVLWFFPDSVYCAVQ